MMRFALFMVPAAIVAAAPAAAENYMTVQQAQAAIFPGATFTPADITLSEAQIDHLVEITQISVFRAKVKVWKASTGGFFFLDQVLGRDDRLTYAIGLDKDGAVIGMEILTCTSGYDGVRSQHWLTQFYGTKSDTISDVAATLRNVTGVTMSSGHITEGVKRVLTTYALFIAPKQG